MHDKTETILKLWNQVTCTYDEGPTEKSTQTSCKAVYANGNTGDSFTDTPPHTPKTPQCDSKVYIYIYTTSYNSP